MPGCPQATSPHGSDAPPGFHFSSGRRRAGGRRCNSCRTCTQTNILGLPVNRVASGHRTTRTGDVVPTCRLLVASRYRADVLHDNDLGSEHVCCQGLCDLDHRAPLSNRSTPCRSARYLTWEELLGRVFAVDGWCCPRKIKSAPATDSRLSLRKSGARGTERRALESPIRMMR
jgi:hypothetical protein